MLTENRRNTCQKKKKEEIFTNWLPSMGRQQNNAVATLRNFEHRSLHQLFQSTMCLQENRGKKN